MLNVAAYRPTQMMRYITAVPNQLRSLYGAENEITKWKICCDCLAGSVVMYFTFLWLEVFIIPTYGVYVGR